MRKYLFRGISVTTKTMIFGTLRVEGCKCYILTPDCTVSHDIPEYRHLGMGCGIEDRNITCRYKAAQYGFNSAIDEFLEMLPIWEEVIPETVGQFTGLTDKNGVKVFEGDIFLINGKAYFVQFLEERGSYVLTTGNGFDSRNCMDFNCDIIFELEVIGNTIDDKNLPEQKND
jgi:hypothetical protein